MAAVAPRRPPRSLSRTLTQGEIDLISDRSSLLDRLLNMGFSQNRCEKAIATTGSLTEERISDCVNWLLAHMDDLSLDDEDSREYILYLCPASGPLCDMLNKFWSETQQVAVNGAHESFPHIRITTFTKIKDSMLMKFNQIVQTTVTSSQNVQTSFELEYQSLTDTAYKYIGLFLSDADDAKLRDLAEEISVNASKMDIKIEPYTRHMHMSLAYRFSDEHQHKIEEFASKIDTAAKCTWELRVYSRDVRSSSHELREVTHEYKGQQEDEISLTIGEMVFAVPDSIHNSIDGWYTGFSLKDGKLGAFPGNYTVKSALEHKTWTLVNSFPLVAHNKLEKVILYENVKCVGATDCHNLDCMKHGEQELSLLFVRHGERIDAVMGKGWVSSCFEESGKDKFLKRYNLNMPDKYVRRRSISDFERDPPITEIGRFQAKLIGNAVLSSSLRIKAIYSSPSLRCIETADIIAKNFDADRRPLIKVENTLFEWLRWHPLVPVFIPPSDLKEQGFDIDVSYKSDMLAFDLTESLEDYYERSSKFCQNLIDKNCRVGGCILLVGHAATPEVCTRQLSKGQPLPQREFLSLINKVPFCEPILASKQDGVWKPVAPPIPRLWHLENKKFDVKLFNSASSALHF